MSEWSSLTYRGGDSIAPEDRSRYEVEHDPVSKVVADRRDDWRHDRRQSRAYQPKLGDRESERANRLAGVRLLYRGKRSPAQANPVSAATADARRYDIMLRPRPFD